MWLMTTTGFYSVVATSTGKIQIRSRCKKDLEDLRFRFGLADIICTPHADYHYRIIVSREVWTGIVSFLSRDVTYTNFKDEIALRDKSRAGAYLTVWEHLRHFFSSSQTPLTGTKKVPQPKEKER